ncbi:MAG: sugar phosphate isomerase/epimerase [Acidobacteriia bacterium]|nr:sugar phosphate isomerase/epimerase [Terriglobia bacterium]
MPFPLGYNTYSLRAFRWLDLELLEYAASQKLDAVYLQDSVDPGNNDPAHWRELKDTAARLGLRLDGGDAGALPRSPDGIDATLARLREGIRHAVGIGSKLVRFRVAGDRAGMPPGPVEKTIETMIRVLRTVRAEAMDAGVKFAIENHKDLFCWQTRQVIDAAGKEFVGSYLDTGNPVFVMEDPLATVETLGPLAVMLHLRDSVVYEAPNGVAVQWVPLGEGVVDFRKIAARAREICPPIAVYNKPITGRPPQILAIYDSEYMKNWGDMRGADLARFIALAKRGHPYEGPMVVEDVPGKMAEPIAAALRYQQREHMERGLEYARKTLELGVRWRVG